MRFKRFCLTWSGEVKRRERSREGEGRVEGREVDEEVEELELDRVRDKERQSGQLEVDNARCNRREEARRSILGDERDAARRKERCKSALVQLLGQEGGCSIVYRFEGDETQLCTVLLKLRSCTVASQAELPLSSPSSPFPPPNSMDPRRMAFCPAAFSNPLLALHSNAPQAPSSATDFLLKKPSLSFSLSLLDFLPCSHPN